MEPDETKVTTTSIPEQSNKASHARFLTTLDDDHLILHLQHVAEIWFKDTDILAWEELVRRFRAMDAERTRLQVLEKAVLNARPPLPEFL